MIRKLAYYAFVAVMFVPHTILWAATVADEWVVAVASRLRRKAFPR
jgi:hypothetical protein